MIDVSIIIVNWNSWEDLRRCLLSIRETLKRSSYEVIVIDNASGLDLQREFLSEFSGLPLRWVRNESNVGFAKACNQGMRLAKGEWYLLLNPDTVVLNGAIDSCVSYMRGHAEAGILGCRLLNEDGSTQLWTAGKFPSVRSAFNHFMFLSRLFPASHFFQGIYLSKEIPGVRDVDWVCGAFLLVRPDTFREAGGMREDYFMYAEDMEWCYRIKRSGRRVIYFPEARIIHRSGGSMIRLKRARYWKGLHSASVFYRTHGGNHVTGALFDAITSLGYLLRTAAYALSMIVCWKSEKALTRVRDSWGFFKASLDILFGRNEQAKERFEEAIS
jgi:GT2 family glycosyltransferase